GAIRVMTTHLEYYSGLQRIAQVEAIRARHAEACGHARVDRELDDPDGPFRSAPQTASAILTGDFNFRPDDPLHGRLQAPLGEGSTALVDAWQALHPHAPHPHTNGVHDREQWPAPYTCDFVFVSEDLVPRLRATRVDADTQASDHQPVLVALGRRARRCACGRGPTFRAPRPQRCTPCSPTSTTRGAPMAA